MAAYTGTGSAGTAGEQIPGGKSAGKPLSVFDRAIGFMDAGEMKVIGVENFGLLCGWDPPSTAWYPGSVHGAWGELRWVAPVLTMPPGPWGAQSTNGPDLPEDRSGQYNTIESFSAIHLYDGDNYGFTDWEAKDNAAAYYHGTATEDNIPMIAISTLYETWPQGYFDSLSNWIPTPGEYHWPGGWALNPDPNSPEYNQPMEGKFVSSKDIFFIADDKYNGVRPGAVTARYGYPVGIDMEVAGYSYASPLYEDVVFFNINFIYRTADELTDPDSRFYDPNRRFYDGPIEDIYFAFFVDPDLPGAFTGNQRQASPWAEDDYAFVIDADDDGTIDVFITHDKKDHMTDQNYPSNTGPVSAYGINFFRTPRIDPGDPASPEIGITGFHWFDQDDAMRPHRVDADWEKVLYAVSAGRPELVPEEERDKWFHGDDPRIDDVELLKDFQESFPAGSRPDIQFWFSSGPFTISPGDTIPIHIGIAGGLPDPGPLDEQGFATHPVETRFRDLFANLAQAESLYSRNFQGSGPPDAPTLRAVGTEAVDTDGLPLIYGQDEKVTLYWDDVAERSVDVVSGEMDFEGYRIYKAFADMSSSRSIDWGTEIYGVDGLDLLGYVPIAQYDLGNGWQDYDRYNPYFYLGDNSGLQYTWTDFDVVNGVRYRYAITAYDHPDTAQGIGTNESAIGFDPRQVNIVDVIPGLRPEGFIEAGTDSAVQRISGSGTGPITLQVIDDMAVTGHEYEISFEDTSGRLTVDVTDLDTGRLLVDDDPAVWTQAQSGAAQPRPIVDGVGLTIINHDVIEHLDQRWETVAAGTSDYLFSALSVTLDEAPRPCDYRVLFGDSTLKYPIPLDPGIARVPFQVFNITDDPGMTAPLELAVGPYSGRYQPWSSGEAVYLFEPDQSTRSWQFSVSWSPETVVDSSVSPPETTYIDPLPPGPGDVYLYRTKKPFTGRDAFRFSTQSPSNDPQKEILDRIKVVPNPYIVSASTELAAREDYIEHQIRFTHLPSRCTIRIYTLRGDLVRTIHHDSPTVGEARWDLLSEERLEVSYGVYIYTVVTPEGKKKIDKFAIIW